MSLDEKDMQPKALKGKNFGRTIQEYRLRNGWTQDELSWRTGINRTHIGRIERDACVPTVSTIERVEDAFRLPRLTLLELKQKAVAKVPVRSEIPGSGVLIRPIKALYTATALRQVFVLDDFLAPRANGEAVLILVDSDCSYSSRQTVCRGEQQVKDGVGKRTLLREVLPNVPVIVGILMTGCF